MKGRDFYRAALIVKEVCSEGGRTVYSQRQTGCSSCCRCGRSAFGARRLALTGCEEDSAPRFYNQEFPVRTPAQAAAAEGGGAACLGVRGRFWHVEQDRCKDNRH